MSGTCSEYRSGPSAALSVAAGASVSGGRVVQQAHHRRVVAPGAVRTRDDDHGRAVARVEPGVDRDRHRGGVAEAELDRHGLHEREVGLGADDQLERLVGPGLEARRGRGVEVAAGAPVVAAHDHGAAVAVADVDELLVVEPHPEARPERVGAVDGVVAPVVVHPGQRARPALVPRVEQVPGVPGLVHPHVEVLAHGLELRLGGRGGHEVGEPGVAAGDGEALAVGAVARAAAGGRGVEHDAAERPRCRTGRPAGPTCASSATSRRSG